MCNDCVNRCDCKGRELFEQLIDAMEIEEPVCKGYKKDISEEEQYKRLRGY